MMDVYSHSAQTGRASL